MIQVSDQLFHFYTQIVQNQGQTTEKSVIEVRIRSFLSDIMVVGFSIFQILQIVNKLRQLARDNAEDLPKVSLVDEGVESGTETDTSGTKSIPLNSDRAVSCYVCFVYLMVAQMRLETCEPARCSN